MKKWIALVITLLMVSCSKQESQAQVPAAAATKQKVVVYNWTEYLPESALQAFTKETGIEVEYATYESNEAMYAKIKLLDGKGYDVVVPSTFYVEKMRKE